MVVYNDDGAGDNGFVRVGTTTGNTINGFGTALQFEAADTEYPGCALINTDKIIIGYVDEGDSNTGKAIACDISTTAPTEVVTCGTAVDYDTTDFYAKYNFSILKISKNI